MEKKKLLSCKWCLKPRLKRGERGEGKKKWQDGRTELWLDPRRSDASHFLRKEKRKKKNPTNNALLINFLLSSDAEIFVTEHRLSMQIRCQNVQKTCVQRVHVPTERPFCTPPLVVGKDNFAKKKKPDQHSAHETKRALTRCGTSSAQQLNRTRMSDDARCVGRHVGCAAPCVDLRIISHRPRHDASHYVRSTWLIRISMRCVLVGLMDFFKKSCLFSWQSLSPPPLPPDEIYTCRPEKKIFKKTY